MVAGCIRTPEFDVLTKAIFEKPPPSNLRKSNFFHFVLTLYDKNENPVEVESGDFVGFPDEGDEGKNRNGIIYRLVLNYASGSRVHQEILLKLVDSQTGSFTLHHFFIKETTSTNMHLRNFKLLK